MRKKEENNFKTIFVGVFFKFFLGMGTWWGPGDVPVK
jgi:hypothetical protein